MRTPPACCATSARPGLAWSAKSRTGPVTMCKRRVTPAATEPMVIPEETTPKPRGTATVAS